MAKTNRKGIVFMVIIGIILFAQAEKKEAQWSIDLQYLIDRCEGTENIYDCGTGYCRDTASGDCDVAYSQCIGASVVHSCGGGGCTNCDDYCSGNTLYYCDGTDMIQFPCPKLCREGYDSFCGKNVGGCVDCLSTSDCGAGEECVNYFCEVSAGECTDSDGGQNLVEKGTVTPTGGGADCVDECRLDGYLWECMCNPSLPDIPAILEIDCYTEFGEGYSCVDGACVGTTPPGCTDTDGDGFGNPASTNCQYATLDCDDTDSSVYPGAFEVCEDGKDNDCSGGDAICPPNCDGHLANAEWCDGNQVKSCSTSMEISTVETCDSWETCTELSWSEAQCVCNTPYYCAGQTSCYTWCGTNPPSTCKLTPTECNAQYVYCYNPSSDSCILRVLNCNTGETKYTSSTECSNQISSCGDGTCDANENCISCPDDCECISRYTCAQLGGTGTGTAGVQGCYIESCSSIDMSSVIGEATDCLSPNSCCKSTSNGGGGFDTSMMLPIMIIFGLLIAMKMMGGNNK